MEPNEIYQQGYDDGSIDVAGRLPDILYNMINNPGYTMSLEDTTYWAGYHDGYMSWAFQDLQATHPDHPADAGEE